MEHKMSLPHELLICSNWCSDQQISLDDFTLGADTVCSAVVKLLRQLSSLLSRACLCGSFLFLGGRSRGEAAHFLDFHLARMSPVPVLTTPHLTLSIGTRRHARHSVLDRKNHGQHRPAHGRPRSRLATNRCLSDSICLCRA